MKSGKSDLLMTVACNAIVNEELSDDEFFAEMTEREEISQELQARIVNRDYLISTSRPILSLYYPGNPIVRIEGQNGPKEAKMISALLTDDVPPILVVSRTTIQ